MLFVYGTHCAARKSFLISENLLDEVIEFHFILNLDRVRQHISRKIEGMRERERGREREKDR